MYCKGIAKVMQRYSKDIAKILQRYCKGIAKVLQRYCKGMTNSYVEEPRKPVSQKRVGLKILGIGDNSFMQYK